MKAERKTKPQPVKESDDLQGRVKKQKTEKLKSLQAVTALKESEKRFRNIIESSKDGIIFFDGKTRKIILGNKAMAKLLGCSKKALIGRSISSLHPPEEWASIEKSFKKHLRGELTVSAGIPILRNDGSVFYADIFSSLTMLEGRTCFSAFFRDITERKRAEEAMRESEERFRLAFENANTGVCLVDLEGNLTKVNNKMCETFGYTKEELERMTVNDIAHPEDIDKSPSFIQKTLRGEIDRGTFEKRYFHKKGHVVTCQVSSTLVYDFEGAPLYFISHVHDITERKRTEEALRESEEKYRNLVERANDGIGIGQNGIMRYANSRLADMIGYSMEEIVGKPFADFFMPEEIPKVMDYYKRRMDGEDLPTTYETALRHKDGSRIEIEINAGLTYYKGKPADLVLSRDITERKRVEEALLESEEKFRNVFDNSSIGMSMTSIDGSVNVNQAFCEMLGYTKEELSGLKWQDLTHPDDIELTQEYLEQLLSGEKTSVRFMKRYITKDGSTLWGDLNTVLQKDKNGNPLYYISALLDISERKRWEALIERTIRETRVRFEVSQALAGQETEDEVLDALIQQADLYPQAQVSILTFERTDTELVGILRRVDSFSSGLTVMVSKGTRFSASEFPTINRYAVDQLFVSNDVFSDERVDLPTRELISQSGGISYAGFRLTAGNELLGLIVAEAKPIGYFDKEKQLLYQTLAEQGAVALRAARLGEQIRESQKRFQGLVETLSDWIWEVNQDGVYTYVSPRVRDSLGHEPEELLGKTPYYLLPPEDGGLVSGNLGRLLASRRPLVGMENTFRHKDGRLIVFETSGTPFFNGEGQFKGYRGVNRDITARKQAEEALVLAEEKYRAIVENAVEGIFQSTSDGKFLMVNTAVAKFHGYDSPQELIADISNIGEQLYVHPEERQRYRRILANEGVVKGFETQFYRKDGTIKWGSMNVRSVRDNEGRILHYEGTIEDITARKEAEEGLQKSLEKLRKALGGIIQAMSLTVETRDPYTAGHQRRVADLARAIAQEMGLPENQVDALRMAGIVHDLGKISIPAEILSKPAQLSDIEFSLIKAHPQISYDILKDIDFNWPVAEIVLQHHERINGSGYPQGLSGKAIYLEARILAVADVVEAISSHRPYRPAYGVDVALEEISKNKDVLYDPEAVEACLRLFREKGFKFE